MTKATERYYDQVLKILDSAEEHLTLEEYMELLEGVENTADERHSAVEPTTEEDVDWEQLEKDYQSGIEDTEEEE